MNDWQPLINRIAKDDSIDEVILSGGDPLTIVDESLGELLRAIEEIEHVARVRFHTRLPIMIPDRVTSRLIRMLSETRLQPVVVLHSNHAAEIDDDVAGAVNRLRQVGIPLLNQSVLLRGVNNSTNSMEKLCRRLVDIGVMPYYMHQLDRVAGAAHFAVEKRAGMEIVEELRARLPGYAVPKFVEEQFGDASKRPIV